ncbi:MAG: biotin transporter BioY [Oscillospiraceae bacterium]|nr:biotin transporter BioY [Oscillospiraceae bacterium]
MNKKISTNDLCLIAVFVAIMAVLSQLSIMLPGGVPLTLQTFGVMLTGIVLGSKKAAVVLLVYIMLGAVGAPVFSPSPLGHGIHRLVAPWGGYLMSLPIMAFLIGIGTDLEYRFSKLKRKPVFATFLILGVVLNLTLGSLWLWFMNDFGIQTAFVVGFVPFVLPEILKAMLAITVGLPVRYATRKIVN